MADKDFEPGEQYDHADIVCPHCGYRNRDASEYCREDEQVADMECGECEKPFKAYASYSVAYISYAGDPS